MQYLGYGARAHKVRRALGAALGLFLIATAQPASAQTSSSGGTSVDTAPSEAARRAALSPYRFIIQNASAPARKPAPVALPAATPAAAAPEPKRSAPAPVQQAAAQPSVAMQKPVEAPPPEPAPEPAVASLSRKPVEPPQPKRDVIPIRTDEPRLPAVLMREHPNGTVRVHFDINPDGSVGDVKVMASTNRALNKASIEAVQKWKFEPVDEVLTVETELVYKFDN
jgi:TonB family protein